MKLPFMKLTEHFYFKCAILLEKICCQHRPPLSNHDNNTIENQKSHFHAFIHVFDKEHEEIIIKIGFKIQIQYTNGENTFLSLGASFLIVNFRSKKNVEDHPINIPTKFGCNWFNEDNGQRRQMQREK